MKECNVKFGGNYTRKMRADYKKHGQSYTLGTTVHSERLFAVSNVCEAAAATAPAKPAATLEAKGCTGPASSIFLIRSRMLHEIKMTG